MEQFNQIIEKIKGHSITSVVLVLLAFLVGWLLIKYATKALERILRRGDKLDISVQRLLCSVFKIAAIFILAISCADKLGIPITSLITLLGALGLAVSLALQDSLKNLAGGIFILVTKPFVTGDFIESCGVSGTVKSIGFIHTVLATIDNRLIFVPNGSLSGDKITNYSAESSRRIDITIPVPYECETARARAVIEGQVYACGGVLGEPQPFVRVWELGSSAVSIMVRVWVKAEDYFDVRCALLEGIKAALDDAGMSVPYNHLDVTIVGKDGK